MKKNNEGFTLVELMAVIAVLAVIALIAYPLVTQTINSSKEKLSKEQVNAVISAAKLYTVKNPHCGCVTVQTLKEKGFLEDKDVVDPKTGTNLTGGVSLAWQNNQYSYQYSPSCAETTSETECE